MDYYLWDGYGAVEDLDEGDPLSYPRAVDALEAAGRSSGRDQTLWGRSSGSGRAFLLAAFVQGKGVMELRPVASPAAGRA